MKRFILFIALIAISTLIYAQNPKFTAVSPSGHTLSYEIDPINNGIPGGGAWVTCEVSHSSVHFNNAIAYPNLAGDIIIPDSVQYNGVTYPVTAIGNRAFYRCQNIHSIVLPSTIVCFAEYSFYNCSGIDTFFVNSATAPELRTYAFTGISNNAVFIVPCGTESSYYYEWGNSYNIDCYNHLLFNVTINSNNDTWGTGNYTALSDSIVEVLATPNYGYHFDHWSFGSTANPDTLLLSSDITITAFFAKNQYTVTGTSNDVIKGTVTGNATVDYLDSVTLLATANYGYHFQRWSDYSSENPRKVAATGNINLTAIFDFNQYTITLSADSSSYGTVSGTGEYNYLAERTISANANYGYHFTEWNDGLTDNPRVFILTQDTQFVALFAKNQYTMRVLSSDSLIGTVTGGGIYDYLDTATLTASATEHYHFVRWSDGNTTNPRRMVVTGDLSHTAIFGIDTHTVSLQAANIAHGTFTGSGNYQYGTAATVEAMPYSGYQFTHWSNGATYNPYTFAVLDDMTLTAFFVAIGESWQDTIVVFDTAYITLHDTTYINVPFHDTTFITMTDTVINTIFDTINHYIHDTIIVTDTVFSTIIDTINRYIHDTTIVTDTLWLTLTDTLWLHDTIIVHDTVYITHESISDVDDTAAKIYQCDGRIIVEFVDGLLLGDVTVYDVSGRRIATSASSAGSLPKYQFEVPTSGTYLVKIGNLPARKLVVIR